MGRYKTYGKKQVINGVTVTNGLCMYEMDYTGEEVYHTVQSGEQFRLDNISYTYYGDPEYWWLIALHNNISSSLFDVSPGDILKIPVNLTLAINSLYEVTT